MTKDTSSSPAKIPPSEQWVPLAMSWPWRIDLRNANPVKKVFVSILRLMVAVVRDLNDGQLNLRAMSLVYTTLLSLVPLLAISFSVLKAFGVHNKIEPVLQRVLEPLAGKSSEITARIVEFVDRVDVSVLGAVGLATLIYTVISLMEKIESAFNYTWHVTSDRSLGARFTQYLSIILVGPVLLFAATALGASVRNADLVEQALDVNYIGSTYEVAALFLPYFLFTVAFALVYMFLPNTQVRLVPALVGGFVTTILWKLLGIAFRTFVSQAASYDAIYSAFATLILFMIWLYAGWLVVLVGASVAYYVQYPSSQKLSRGDVRLSSRMEERLTLMVLAAIADAFYDRKSPLSQEQLAHKIGVSARVIQDIMATLVQKNILTQTSDRPPSFVPGSAFDELSVAEVLIQVRQSGGNADIENGGMQVPLEISRICHEIDGAIRNKFGDLTVKAMSGHVDLPRKKGMPDA